MGLLENRLRNTRPRGSHGHVVDALGFAILAGEWPEGTILPGDAELIERFGVSRTVLREAMKTLAAKRLIQAKSRVGTRVLPRDAWNFMDADVIGWRLRVGVDLAFVTHLVEMRLALEPACAALAARRATEEDLESLRGIVARMRDPAHSRTTIAQVDLEFHVAVACMSGNPLMRSVTALIEAFLALAFEMSSPALSPEGIERLAQDHAAILAAIEAREEDQAADMTRHVIEVGMARLRNALVEDGR
ncbi:FadR/GntR family transcriptional regulator [Falsirhodobacter sp. 20TX0035]|uniref:FadR/GntR family transcriptional regulator n=1 Tax=Falsirhodobacter sp. 20TX0035 TaxID=3022019 RepID=UPI00232EB313|nr:FadR/GntR family transcriptional regulator [Falsirhodobacter sp. 20TX0035]MDB6454812.1 FadR/GntR family transcriptional regulator [Falsirhodobacter sp. 20TX0035]